MLYFVLNIEQKIDGAILTVDTSSHLIKVKVFGRKNNFLFKLWGTWRVGEIWKKI